MHHADLNDALESLGALLLTRDEAHEIVLIGGGALLLTGLIERSTRDLDIVARVERDEWIEGEPLPAPLLAGIREVARALDLPEDWLNAGPSSLLRFGLPPGFEGRVHTRQHGGLTIHLAARRDQVALKLYAAVDRGPKSKHFKDLMKLQPNEELRWAARWCRTHDPSEGFRDELLRALCALGVEVTDEL